MNGIAGSLKAALFDKPICVYPSVSLGTSTACLKFHLMLSAISLPDMQIQLQSHVFEPHFLHLSRQNESSFILHIMRCLWHLVWKNSCLFWQRDRTKSFCSVKAQLVTIRNIWDSINVCVWTLRWNRFCFIATWFDVESEHKELSYIWKLWPCLITMTVEA